MNDNQNHIGTNWVGRAPRSLSEAFPMHPYLRMRRWRMSGLAWAIIGAAIIAAGIVQAFR